MRLHDRNAIPLLNWLANFIPALNYKIITYFFPHIHPSQL